MSPNIELNRDKALKLIHALLHNTYFEGFKFDTSFTLRFSRDSSAHFGGHALPMRIEFHILNDWWFYSHEEWQKRLIQFPHIESAEPDEPVLAFELANLRWIKESAVDSVSLNDGRLLISFKNGKKITVSCEPTEGESWILCEYGIGETNWEWSVVCENREFFVKTP